MCVRSWLRHSLLRTGASSQLGQKWPTLQSALFSFRLCSGSLQASHICLSILHRFVKVAQSLSVSFCTLCVPLCIVLLSFLSFAIDFFFSVPLADSRGGRTCQEYNNSSGIASLAAPLVASAGGAVIPSAFFVCVYTFLCIIYVSVLFVLLDVLCFCVWVQLL